jgi:hypothetical protein
MRFKKSLLAMMLFGATAAQADYQFEVVGSLTGSTIEQDHNSIGDVDTDSDESQLVGVIYFSPVVTGNGPLAEADFLSKTGGVALNISRESTETDPDYPEREGAESKTDAEQLVGRFIVPSSGMIVDVGLARAEFDDQSADNNDHDSRGFLLGLGGYLNDNTALILSLGRTTAEFDRGFDYSSQSVGLAYKQLFALTNGQFLSIAPSLSLFSYEVEDTDFDGDGATLGIDLTWYLTRQLGISAGVRGTSTEDDAAEKSDGKSYIGVDYFVNEQFRLGGKLIGLSGEDDYDMSSDEDSDYEGGGIEFEVAARF